MGSIFAVTDMRVSICNCPKRAGDCHMLVDVTTRAFVQGHIEAGRVGGKAKQVMLTSFCADRIHGCHKSCITIIWPYEIWRCAAASLSMARRRTLVGWERSP